MENEFEYIKNPLRELPSGIMLPELNLSMEKISEEDREYIMQMYPVKARMIMALVEEECDKLEYEGSPMFAYFPDKETMLKIARDIYFRMGEEDEMEVVHVLNFKRQPKKPCLLQQLIEVLVCQEFYCRRNRYRNRKRYY